MRRLLAGLALGACALAAGLAGVPAPARAELRFCNESSYLLDTAVAEEIDDGIRVAGWFRIDPGACETIIAEALDDRGYYAFARTRPAHGASRRLTAGDRVLCVDLSDFDFVSANGCTGRGLQKVEFSRIDTGGAPDWAATFAEGGPYDLGRARVAGVQRLLRELGYEAGSIDGHTGGRTTRAIREFQEANGLTRDGNIDSALYQALEAAAQRRLRRTGFHFCNDTERLIWAAIGYRRSEEWQSSGWIRVPAGECAPAITSALDEPIFYAYAEAVDDAGDTATRAGAPMVWGGDRSFCTKPTRFFIRGRTNCAARGYDETPFQEIQVGDAETHTFRLR